MNHANSEGGTEARNRFRVNNTPKGFHTPGKAGSVVTDDLTYAEPIRGDVGAPGAFGTL